MLVVAKPDIIPWLIHTACVDVVDAGCGWLSAGTGCKALWMVCFVLACHTVSRFALDLTSGLMGWQHPVICCLATPGPFTHAKPGVKPCTTAGSCLELIVGIPAQQTNCMFPCACAKQLCGSALLIPCTPAPLGQGIPLCEILKKFSLHYIRVVHVRCPIARSPTLCAEVSFPAGTAYFLAACAVVSWCFCDIWCTHLSFLGFHNMCSTLCMAEVALKTNVSSVTENFRGPVLGCVVCVCIFCAHGWWSSYEWVVKLVCLCFSNALIWVHTSHCSTPLCLLQGTFTSLVADRYR